MVPGKSRRISHAAELFSPTLSFDGPPRFGYSFADRFQTGHGLGDFSTSSLHLSLFSLPEAAVPGANYRSGFHSTLSLYAGQFHVGGKHPKHTCRHILLQPWFFPFNPVARSSFSDGEGAKGCPGMFGLACHRWSVPWVHVGPRSFCVALFPVHKGGIQLELQETPSNSCGGLFLHGILAGPTDRLFTLDHAVQYPLDLF